VCDYIHDYAIERYWEIPWQTTASPHEVSRALMSFRRGNVLDRPANNTFLLPEAGAKPHAFDHSLNGQIGTFVAVGEESSERLMTS
jgi:hypothetical protein